MRRTYLLFAILLIYVGLLVANQSAEDELPEFCENSDLAGLEECKSPVPEDEQFKFWENYDPTANEECQSPVAEGDQSEFCENSDLTKDQECQSSDVIQAHEIEYLLYTSLDQIAPFRLKPNDLDSLDQSKFNPKIETKIVSHGWRENGSSSTWMAEMKDSFLRMGDYNVILVNWAKYSRTKNYIDARMRVVDVAEQLGSLLSFIQKERKEFSGDRVHIIGFSLGAHIAAMTGLHFKNIARITGLDPAGPGFFSVGLDGKLDKTDAKFVDVVHTNTHFLGYRPTIGHVDFYVNGGSGQFGCYNKLIKPISGGVACDHSRAYEYFIESLQSNEKALAYKCPKYKAFQRGDCDFKQSNILGLDATISTPGFFYLYTWAEKKFFATHLLLKIELEENQVNINRLEVSIDVEDRIKPRYQVSKYWKHKNEYQFIVIMPAGQNIQDLKLNMEIKGKPKAQLEIRSLEIKEVAEDNRWCFGKDFTVKGQTQLGVISSGACSENIS